MQPTMIDGVYFETELSAQGIDEARKQVQLSNQRSRKLLKKLWSMNEIEFGVAVGKAICNPDLIISSAVRVNRKLPLEERYLLEECLQLPGHLSLIKKSNELVEVRPQPKGSGGVRPICKFRKLHKTRQEIVARLLGARFKPRAFQFSMDGPQAAISSSRAVLKDLKCVARLDIKNCYGSFNETLREVLPLPKKVVEYVVLARHMRVVGKKPTAHWQMPMDQDSLSTILLEALQGLAQGSASSPIVAAFVIAMLDWKVFPDVALVNLYDDFLLMASSDELLEDKIGELQDAVARLPGGKFNLVLKDKGPITEGIDFLGHRLQEIDGSLQVTAAEKNVSSFFSKLVKFDEQLPKVLAKPDQEQCEKALIILSQQYQYVQGWCGAFKECDDLQEFQGVWDAQFKDTLQLFGLDSGKISSAAAKQKKHDFESYETTF